MAARLPRSSSPSSEVWRMMSRCNGRSIGHHVRETTIIAGNQLKNQHGSSNTYLVAMLAKEEGGLYR